MAKIMLVEDDRSLSEIYAIRLQAEGYQVVSAGDGEEALAMAVRERPDLIISDVMMPRISGFDMLDILRSTPETKNIKVIVMTALSSDEQRKRGEALGADRYLVKSQVGIEDVVNAVKEVLGGGDVMIAGQEVPPVVAMTQPEVLVQGAQAANPVPAQPAEQPAGGTVGVNGTAQ
jgi:DNA-binding response OmpR family regulator